MFNKGDKKDAALSSQESINLIGTGTNIKGDVVANGDIRIDGTVIGTVNAKGKLVLGPSGLIEGEVMFRAVSRVILPFQNLHTLKPQLSLVVILILTNWLSTPAPRLPAIVLWVGLLKK